MLDEAGRLAAKLSKVQRKALLAASDGRDCSYTMRVSISTCEALNARGLFRRVAGPGSMWSPQTAIRFTLTDLGKATAQHLQEQSR